MRRIALLALTTLVFSQPAFAAPRRKPVPVRKPVKPGKPGKGGKGGKATPAPQAEEPTEAPPNESALPGPSVTSGPSDKPWAQGVPQEAQDKASALYKEGNDLFGQQAHAPALEKYREAIALWDHPLIRFNMAVTEIRLERILEAAEDLEKALRFADQPFTAELYDQALNYQSLVKGRVGYVEATCDQVGARMLLDGKPWFECPGTKQMRVLAGEHVIVGEKPSYLSSSAKVIVVGGQTAKHESRLIPLDSAVVLKYPYRRWIPWTTSAMGFAVALGGVGTWFMGRNQMDQFEADFATQCSNGCEPGLTDPSHRALAAQRDSASLKGQVGIGMMGVGGAVMATGLVLVLLNRPTRVLPGVEVAPSGGGGTATVGWTF